MKCFEETSSFYNEVISLIDLEDYESAIKSVKMNINTLEDPDDVALAYLHCGFLFDKLKDYKNSIDYFSKSISQENELDMLNQRSKDISYSGRSNSRYKNGDYQGAIEDKRKAKMVRLLEVEKYSESEDNQIDYKNILLGTFTKICLEPKYKLLIKVSKIKTSKYDLIADFKKVISKKRKEEVIEKLEHLSESKFKICDYKGSINAIRRAEKYY